MTGNPLSAIPYFAALSPDEQARVMTLTRRRRFAAGEVLFREGEPCAGLFIVVSGMIKLYRTSADGKEQVLRHMPAGESLNEVPVFDGGPNPVSATAIEPAEVLVLSRERVLELLREYPALAAGVVQLFASRLRHLVAVVEDLSFRQVTARVARVVLQSVAPHEGIGAGVGGRAHVTQREIAEMAGTSREVVARALRALEDAGAIRIDRQSIRVADEGALRALS